MLSNPLRLMPLAIAGSLLLQACCATAQSTSRHEEESAAPVFQTVSSPSDVDSHWSRGLDSVVGTDDLAQPIGSAIHSADRDLATYETGTATGECDPCVDETPLSRFRKSAYQGSTLTAGALGENGESLGFYEVTTRFALPIGGLDHVLLFAPVFRHNFLDYAGPVDTPSELFNAGVNITWFKKLGARSKAIAMVTPGVRSDFQTSENAFRLFALGVVTYEWIPKKLDVGVGAVYLDRDGFPLLPAIGFTWTPSNLWKIDANFPRPRIARRLDKQGEYSETWIYTGVGLGGNTWAVERANGQDDELSIIDYQWVVGWEHLRSGGRGLFLETGLALGRKIEYESDGIERDLGDSLFLRGGLTL